MDDSDDTRSPASAPAIRSPDRVAPPEMSELLERGMSLERQGKRAEARALYEQALERPDAAMEPWLRAQLHRWAARTHMNDGDLALAEREAAAALAVSCATDDERSRGHAINMLAGIRWARGELDEARELFLEARESAQRSGDMQVASMTASNLGAISTVRGEYVEALQFHRASVKEARSGGLPDEALKALNNIGLLYTRVSRFPEAEAAYEEALKISATTGDSSARITVQLNVARLRLRQADHIAAQEACDSASALARELGDDHMDAEAAQIRGIIARVRGESASAEQLLLQAEQVSARRGDLIVQGESARELADLYRSQGRNRETLVRLNQAHRLFFQLRARREIFDVGQRTAQLESDFLDVARKWGESIESKDVYTQGHCERVANLACALWERVGEADGMSLFWFRIGALLHDVGKLLIPATVLNKPGPLTEEEWGMIRRHPTSGVELLAEVEFPWDVRPIVESHHERWDGGGYPHGLAGGEIPVTARVLCIADVYDALTSQRSYKRSLGHDEVMEIMRADAGLQFDPELFREFEEVARLHQLGTQLKAIA